MNAESISRWLGILAALGAIWARFIAVEERQENQLRALSDVRGYLTAAENRISALERDREMLERVHRLELRLGTIEDHMQERRR
jgi:hypothetical protein